MLRPSSGWDLELLIGEQEFTMCLVDACFDRALVWLALLLTELSVVKV